MLDPQFVTRTGPGGPDDSLLLRVGCSFSFATAAAVPAVFLVRPDGLGPHRLLEERWIAEPFVDHRDFVDLHGNVARRLTLPAGRGSVNYEALVETVAAADDADPWAPELPIDRLPDEVLAYLLPSRYCASDQLVEQAFGHFGGLAPGYQRVAAITDYAHRSLRFGYGTSGSSTSAIDALASGMGVCRDYAHLAVSFCRAMSIPARYVFGYLPDVDVAQPASPMDFAAWHEVYLGGRWWTFDARNNRQRKGRVVIARGRDAADVAMVTSYGPVSLQAMTVTAQRLG